MIRKMMELTRKWHVGQFRKAPDGEIPPPYRKMVERLYFDGIVSILQ